ncbi:MAG: DNA-protecting protein DprA [Proteobacteria bacterium]|nr:DNA-protecting protein DprA [Pseudomonadota bacterium]
MSAQRALNTDEKLDWLRLFRSEHVGPITFYRLIERFGSAANAIDALPSLAKRGGQKNPIKLATRESAEKELKAVNDAGGIMIARCEPDYPPLLAAVEDAPPVISVLGRRELLKKTRALAVVGSRNASLNGRQFAEKLARDCGQAGFTVVSGLARGIDAAAHRGGLATGTIAVLGCCISIVYPEENKKLYEEIAEQGVIISECPFGTPPSAHQFPKRNRIISGLSEGVAVVEAVQQSGSLITARLALEQGREVFAVPGSPLDPRSAGSNNLLRQGATLVENAQDVLNELQGVGISRFTEPQAPVNGAAATASEDDVATARDKLLQTLGPSPLRLDDVIRDLNLPTSAVLAALLELELAGKAQRQPGGMICLLSA